MSEQFIDITPTPRVLRILGDIPFATWNCLAELMDNSFDAFASAQASGTPIDNPRVNVSWSKANCLVKDRMLVFEDNGVGMPLEVLQNAAKAGFSSNDPIHNLGLFGMGFNIATARLGDETTFMSATKDSTDWVGIRISFDELNKSGKFAAPVVHEPKQYPDECGTRIVVRKLRDGIWNELSNSSKESSIRRRLGIIYSTILTDTQISVFVQGKPLVPQKYCVWGEDRFVVHKHKNVSAVVELDEDLGDSYFDPIRNRYLTGSEYDDLPEVEKAGIKIRNRRIKGWLGVQRFNSPTDFGIDFIRNGRKILIADKTIFQFENPDTGALISEYPIELGTTIGGRIVGEVHVNYLIPTYQKNDFDRTDIAWQLTREAIRGAGPLLPKSRQALGYSTDNESPLGSLVNAYRQITPGTRCLCLNHSLARQYYEKFLKGDPKYLSDAEWYKACQAEDKAKEEPDTPPQDLPGKVDSGINDLGPDDEPEESPSSVEPSKPAGGSTLAPSVLPTKASEKTQSEPLTGSAFFNDLKSRSEKLVLMSGKYAWGKTPGIDVTVWQVKKGEIKTAKGRQPSYFTNESINADFFFDPTHPAIADYPIAPKHYLLVALTGFFQVRDHEELQSIFFGLVENCLQDERLNQDALRERGFSITNRIKERLPELLQGDFPKVKNIIKEVSHEEEKLVSNLLKDNFSLVQEYNEMGPNAYLSLAYLPDETVARLIEKMPEAFLDGKVFKAQYQSLKIGDDDATSRLRALTLQMILSYFKDVIFLVGGAKTAQKQELMRYSNTFTILENMLV